MTICLGKNLLVSLLCMSFVNVYEFLYVILSRLVLRVGYGI